MQTQKMCLCRPLPHSGWYEGNGKMQLFLSQSNHNFSCISESKSFQYVGNNFNISNSCLLLNSFLNFRNTLITCPILKFTHCMKSQWAGISLTCINLNYKPNKSPFNKGRVRTEAGCLHFQTTMYKASAQHSGQRLALQGGLCWPSHSPASILHLLPVSHFLSHMKRS